MITSILCDYSDACTHVTGTMLQEHVTGTHVTVTDRHIRTIFNCK